jgi:hypothetical protein
MTYANDLKLQRTCQGQHMFCEHLSYSKDSVDPLPRAPPSLSSLNNAISHEAQELIRLL